MQIISEKNQLRNRIREISLRFEGHDVSHIHDTVREIIADIRLRGHQALREYTHRLDRQDIDNFWLSTKGSYERLEAYQQRAIELAVERIRRFQEAICPQTITLKNSPTDIQEARFTPIDSVGIYVPGGTAPLLSTVLMTVIPAQVAGVKNITLTSPPVVHDYIKAVADRLGIERIFQAGGAQAIASLAYGVEGLDPVDKIFGPGNFYVTLAKKEVYGQVGIDSLYGPSELFIVADPTVSPKSLAHDLMSQLEHGSGLEATCLITTSKEHATLIEQEFQQILENQPNKAKIQKAEADFGVIGVVDSIEEGIELANMFAPEHLELKIKNSNDYVHLVRNAGAVFINSSNEAFGDYLAGPSHCLPTGRSARFSSGLSVMDFLKCNNIVSLSATPELVEATATLARMEGLEAHAQAAEAVRF